jgi:hypothetical protein
MKVRINKCRTPVNCGMTVDPSAAEVPLEPADGLLRCQGIIALRFKAWACVIELAVASWTPGQEMVRTGFNTRLEHVAAYLIAGVPSSLPIPEDPFGR